jgi:hypothetical protein
MLPCIVCDCCDGLADSVAHCNCLAEYGLEFIFPQVSLVNEIGDEGAKALGDALKGNTTLTSLSLNLAGE